jgi:hypothetical protein
MIGGEAAVLAEKLDVLHEDPKATVLDVQGSPRAPTLIVIETEPGHIEKLKDKLGDDVIVEPNNPLEPFG